MRLYFTKLLFSVLLLLLGSTVQAQMYIIPQAGLNLSDFAFNSDEYSKTSNVGYQVGALGRFGKNAFLQTGIFWNQISSEIQYEDSLIKNSGPVVVKGILVPVQLGFNLYDADIFRIRLQAGINLSFPISVDPNVFSIEKSHFNGSNVGAAVGFGFDIFRFVMDANFSFGINDMLTVNDTSVTLKQYTLSVGYLIGNSY